jgi:hypothetical protein
MSQDAATSLRGPGKDKTDQHPALWQRPSINEEISLVSGLPFLALRLLALVSVVFLVVDGALPQLEMAVFGNRVPISTSVLKFFLLLSFSIAAVLRGRLHNPKLIWLFLGVLGFLLVDSAHLYFQVNQSPVDILIGYNAYYALLLTSIFALIVPLNISDRTLIFLLILASIPCVILGGIQFVRQMPIVPTISSDGNFGVSDWTDYGSFRVFSFFQEPPSCALFFTLLASYSIAISARPKNRVFAAALLTISLGMCWASGTRTLLVSVPFALTTAAIITFWKTPNRARYLPLFWLVAAVPICAIAYWRSEAGGASSSVSDTSTFTMRVAEWAYDIPLILTSHPGQMLLGLGIVQHRKANQLPTFIGSDDLYVSVALHIGLVGLVLILLIIWLLWEELRKKAELRTSSLHTAVAAAFSTIFLGGVFEINQAMMAATFLLFAVTRSGSSQPQEEPDRNLQSSLTEKPPDPVWFR